MGEIAEGLTRALSTCPAPAGTEARLRFLLRNQKGSTAGVAALLGVSQRTVQRWIIPVIDKRHRPGPAQAQAIEDAVRVRWQPLVRARLRARAERDGFVLYTRAQFGFASSAGSSDDPRRRRIAQHLSGAVARELLAAREAGASEQQQTAILARALGHGYFRDDGQRGHGLQIAFTEIEFADFRIG